MWNERPESRPPFLNHSDTNDPVLVLGRLPTEMQGHAMLTVLCNFVVGLIGGGVTATETDPGLSSLSRFDFEHVSPPVDSGSATDRVLSFRFSFAKFPWVPRYDRLYLNRYWLIPYPSRCWYRQSASPTFELRGQVSNLQTSG